MLARDLRRAFGRAESAATSRFAASPPTPFSAPPTPPDTHSPLQLTDGSGQYCAACAVGRYSSSLAATSCTAYVMMVWRPHPFPVAFIEACASDHRHVHPMPLLPPCSTISHMIHWTPGAPPVRSSHSSPVGQRSDHAPTQGFRAPLVVLREQASLRPPQDPRPVQVAQQGSISPPQEVPRVTPAPRDSTSPPREASRARTARVGERGLLRVARHCRPVQRAQPAPSLLPGTQSANPVPPGNTSPPQGARRARTVRRGERQASWVPHRRQRVRCAPPARTPLRGRARAPSVLPGSIRPRRAPRRLLRALRAPPDRRPRLALLAARSVQQVATLRAQVPLLARCVKLGGTRPPRGRPRTTCALRARRASSPPLRAPQHPQRATPAPLALFRLPQRQPARLARSGGSRRPCDRQAARPVRPACSVTQRVPQRASHV